MLAQYLDVQPARVGRMAAVVARIADHDSPGLFLARYFCQPRWETAPLNRPDGFELHAHKRFEMQQFPVNSWVRNKVGQIVQSRARVVVVEQDINTLQEETASRDYRRDDIAEFFASAAAELDTILRLYYPEEKSNG